MANSIETPSETDTDGERYRRIELVWPGKNENTQAGQLSDGQWTLSIKDALQVAVPLDHVEQVGRPAFPASAVLFGSRLAALNCLSVGLAQGVRLVYLDLPRLRIDNSEAEFKGVETRVHSTWLEVVRQHIKASFPLLRRDGFIVVNCGDLEAPYVRIILNEVMGVGNHVATIVWQRSYAPRNMRGMTEFTSTHDFFIVFAVDRLSLPYVGLKVQPEGFGNSDGDPRGPWKAEHKGAATRRDSTDFAAQVPPYRWRLVQGSLPPGLWRLSPLTGVIWGKPTETGSFAFKVEVSDAKGATSLKSLKIVIENQPADPADLPSLPWLFKTLKATGALKISTSKLPKGAVGQEYSAVILAEGGHPYTGPGRRPGKGRYYEFADRTLEAAYLRDSVKEDAKSIPHPKNYLASTGDHQIRNQQTWWPGRSNDDEVASGYTQDATRHLKKLEEAGLIAEITSAAKPEPLIGRLLDIFSDENDFVLEVFGEGGDLSAVAAKKSRAFLFLVGESRRDRELAVNCSIPRLKAVVAGKDCNLEALTGDQAVGAYIPFSGSGAFQILRLGQWFLKRDSDADYPEINLDRYKTLKELKAALLTTQGFLPTGSASPDGLSWDGMRAAIVIEPDIFLSESIVSEVVSAYLPKFSTVTIFYFRRLDDFDEKLVKSSIVFRRVPFELTVYPS